MSYTNAELIGNFLQRTLNDNELGYLAILLPTIDAWIDRYTDSHFEDVEVTTRHFDGGSFGIDVDPFVAESLTGIKSINDDGSDSYLYDLETTPEIKYEPVNEPVVRELRKRHGHFPRGIQNIAVTAKFTEYVDAVPSDIQSVATMLAAGVLNQGKNASSGGNVQSESLEGHSITYDSSNDSLEGIATANPTVKGLLDQRRELLVG